VNINAVSDICTGTFLFPKKHRIPDFIPYNFMSHGAKECFQFQAVQ